MPKQVFQLLSLSFLTICALGCGGGVAPGVADEPDEAPPVMTPEEEANEEESAANAAGANQE
jgi:hypothetical protein